MRSFRRIMISPPKSVPNAFAFAPPPSPSRHCNHCLHSSLRPTHFVSALLSLLGEVANLLDYLSSYTFGSPLAKQ
jgi:hypothetical protein